MRVAHGSAKTRRACDALTNRAEINGKELIFHWLVIIAGSPAINLPFEPRKEDENVLLARIGAATLRN